MAIIENWLPPSRENWELICTIFYWFPVVTILQWAQPWYGMGKTSTNVPGNLPGKLAWITMEIPGFITLLIVMSTLPSELGLSSLPWQNWAMACIFTTHYLYRAILAPLISPSLSPIHILVWLSAIIFQLLNALSISGYLAGHGPITAAAWSSSTPHVLSAFIPWAMGRLSLGFCIWGLGFALTIWHDDILREIRRGVSRGGKGNAASGKAKASSERNSVDKVYVVPKDGLFKYILYPHYLFEWLEWTGFWLMGGGGFLPGRSFVVNEVATMLPRAVRGKWWYVERFGRKKVGKRTAIIPGIL